MEKLKIQTLTTYNDLKNSQAPQSEIRRVQEAFSLLTDSCEAPQIIRNEMIKRSGENQIAAEVKQIMPPPPPPPAPPLMMNLFSSVTSLFKAPRVQTNLVRLPLNPSSVKPGLDENTIFSVSLTEPETRDVLNRKLQKNFKRVVAQSRMSKLNPLPVPTKALGEQKKIQNVFEYQRAIQICKFSEI